MLRRLARLALQLYRLLLQLLLLLGGGVVARPWRKEDVATGCRAKIWLWDRTAPRDAGCPLGRCRTQGQIEGLHKPPPIDGCAARAHGILRAEHVALAGRLDLAL